MNNHWKPTPDERAQVNLAITAGHDALLGLFKDRQSFCAALRAAAGKIEGMPAKFPVDEQVD